MANAKGLHFTLEIAGVTDAALAVIRFKHREHLSRPFKLSVTLASPERALDYEDWRGRSATLSLWQEGEVKRLISGIVTGSGRGDFGHRRTRYEITVRPALWLLSQRQNSRIFELATPQAIIDTLLAEHGITQVAWAVRRELSEREYCTQHRESDLDFLERLAAEEGLIYYHEFAGPDHRLVFTDHSGALPSLGERLYHRRAGGRAAERHIHRLSHVARMRPTRVTLQDRTFKHPAYAQSHTLQVEDGELQSHGELEHYDYPGRFKSDVPGQAFSRHRLEYLRRDVSVAEAESDLAELMPGTRFDLTGHDVDSLNRQWQAVWVTHIGTQHQALEEDAIGATDRDREGLEGATHYTNRLTLIPADQPWRPTPNPKPRIDGPQIATVVGPEDEEIYVDSFGRVRVQFPWSRDGTASAWLRVAQGWAGGGYGVMALPRVGHEVVVSYLDGDPDQPLVTGSVYNAVNQPPYELPEHKTRMTIRSKSHQGSGFNELALEDRSGEELVWLHAQRNLELLTRHDRQEEVGHDSRLRVKHDRTSEIDNNEFMTVHGERRTEIQGDDHQVVHGTSHQRHDQSLLIEAGREVHIKAHKIVLESSSGWVRIDGGGVSLSPRLQETGGSAGGAGQSALTPSGVEELEAPVPRMSQLKALLKGGDCPICGSDGEGGAA